MSDDQDRLKRAAAESAVALVMDGMTVGLGTGTTAKYALEALGRRVREGLGIAGIPSSERTSALARELGIPLASFADRAQIDLTIDGADEVETASLNLIKGHGGALLREKIVASASRQLVIIVDESKLVGRLGAATSLPVEVIPFGWEATARRLAEMGIAPSLRSKTGGGPFVSDGGHYILDCAIDGVNVGAEALASDLDRIVGVVEHGLFLGMTSQVHVAGSEGVRILHPESQAA